MFTELLLGRLKHTTSDSCPDCNQAKLQLRVREVEGKESDYLYCPKCEYEGRPKKSKTDGIWKKKIKEGELYAEKDIQPVRRTERVRVNSGKDNRSHNKRGS